MPLIYNRKTRSLDASRTPFVKAKSLLKPYPDELMDAHDVSPIVNSAKYAGPECIKPVSDDEIPSGSQLFLL
jgi:putative SOS response-associated peptidase YedK